MITRFFLILITLLFMLPVSFCSELLTKEFIELCNYKRPLVEKQLLQNKKVTCSLVNYSGKPTSKNQFPIGIRAEIETLSGQNRFISHYKETIGDPPLAKRQHWEIWTPESSFEVRETKDGKFAITNTKYSDENPLGHEAVLFFSGLSWAHIATAGGYFSLFKLIDHVANPISPHMLPYQFDVLSRKTVQLNQLAMEEWKIQITYKHFKESKSFIHILYIEPTSFVVHRVVFENRPDRNNIFSYFITDVQYQSKKDQSYIPKKIDRYYQHRDGTKVMSESYEIKEYKDYVPSKHELSLEQFGLVEPLRKPISGQMSKYAFLFYLIPLLIIIIGIVIYRVRRKKIADENINIPTPGQDK